MIIIRTIKMEMQAALLNMGMQKDEVLGSTLTRCQI